MLGIIGTGGQSLHHLRATMAERRITKVHAWDMNPDGSARFARTLRDMGIDCTAEPSAEAVARAAEIIVTVTPLATADPDARLDKSGHPYQRDGRRHQGQAGA